MSGREGAFCELKPTDCYRATPQALINCINVIKQGIV